MGEIGWGGNQILQGTSAHYIQNINEPKTKLQNRLIDLCMYTCVCMYAISLTRSKKASEFF